VTDQLVVTANAKLTLSLRVTGVRPDGYHELDALVVSLWNPFDTVRVSRAVATSLAVHTTFDVPSDTSNLAARAADALGAPVAITLQKGIPPGAGLGGGSADAAAVLKAVRALYGLARTDAELETIGARLGADVPVCLRGGALRVRGVGEQLESCTLPDLHTVAVIPGFQCSTPAVYRAWDELGGPVGREIDVGIAGLPSLRNDLEPAAAHVEPRLVELRDVVESTAKAASLLAGSGASYVVVFADSRAADVAADRLRRSSRLASLAANDLSPIVVRGHTIDHGVVLGAPPGPRR
jgi:4-diphosphocytidyl-2-C-methyl-D-erythritol kinase